MKKYSWIVALLVALAFAFAACDDGDSSKKKDDGNKDNPTVELTAADITLYAVGETAQLPTITGNKVKYDGTVTGVTSSGFGFDFPDSVIGKGYGSIIVEMKVLAITTPSFISFNAKDDKNIQNDVLIVGHTQQYHNELKIGTVTDKEVSAACGKPVCLVYTQGTCIVGATGSAEYPMNKLTKGRIVFQYNTWADDIKEDPTYASWTSATGAPNFEIEVTKITFPGGAAVEEEKKEEATAGVLFDFTEWVAAADALNDSGDPKAPIAKSGSPTLAITSGALVISGRTADWNCIDLQTGGFNLDYTKFDYKLTVTGSLGAIQATADPNPNFLKVGQTGSPYGELVRSSEITTANTATTITANLKEKGSNDEPWGNLRIQTTGTQDFTITALKLEAVAK